MQTIYTRQEGVPLVKVTRSGVTESIHRGSIVTVMNGIIVESIGDLNKITPMRSTAKPFQIIPLLENGGLKYYDLKPEEIAVMVSSHNGEEKHVNVILQLLQKGSFNEKMLQCGSHPPYFQWIRDSIYKATGKSEQQVHNNCSGKHTGILLACRLLGIDSEKYWEPEHKIQKIIKRSVSNALEIKENKLTIGVDGCGIPTYNTSLSQIAKAYYRLCKSNERSALKLVYDSMLTDPFMVAGSGRLDTELMQFTGYVAKIGSDGIYCIASRERDFSIAVKIDSGSEEASQCVALELLRKYNYLQDDILTKLAHYWRRPVFTCTGIKVGQYEAIF